MPLQVQASKYWNDTGFIVAAGDLVEISATGEWYDAHHVSGPGGYEPPAWLHFFDSFRRVPDSGWFELCGCIDKRGVGGFTVGTGGQLLMPESGQLYLFANDVPGFYFNNSGALEVTVKLLGPPQA